MKFFFFFFILFTPVLLWAQEEVVNRIERLLARSLYREALFCTDSLLREGYGRSDLLFYSGKASEGLMRYPAAYRYYRQWRELDTANRDACLAVARSAALAGRTKEALKEYERLAADDTLDFTVNYALARLYQQNGSLFKAILVYDRLRIADTSNTLLLKRLGECYTETGLYMSGIRCYCDAFRLDPEDGNMALKAVNTMLAHREQLTDFVDYALDMLDTALVYSPHLNTLKQTKGILQYVANRFERTEEIFTRLIETGDTVRLNYKYQGLARYQQQKYFQALTSLARADSLFRDSEGKRTDMEVAMRYGEILARVGRPGEALQVFEEIEAQLQPDARFLSHLAMMCGMACSGEANIGRSAAFYWKAYKLNPKNTQAISNFTSLKYDVLSDEEKKTAASPREIREALFAHILFLQNVKDKAPVREDSMHAASRELLKKALEEMFFQGEEELTVTDPEGKNYVYTREEIRQMTQP